MHASRSITTAPSVRFEAPSSGARITTDRNPDAAPRSPRRCTPCSKPRSSTASILLPICTPPCSPPIAVRSSCRGSLQPARRSPRSKSRRVQHGLGVTSGRGRPRSYGQSFIRRAVQALAEVTRSGRREGRIVGVMVGARGVHVQAKPGHLRVRDTRPARAVDIYRSQPLPPPQLEGARRILSLEETRKLDGIVPREVFARCAELAIGMVEQDQEVPP